MASAAWGRPAFADEFFQHAVMNCAEKAVWAEVTTHGTYNDAPAPTGVSDCELKGFGPVRLRVGAGPVYAHGKGYGSPTMFVSLWVKQSKVVSRAEFECEYEGRCGLRIAVSQGGLRVCRKPSGAAAAPESCKFAAWTELPADRDTSEYPLQGQRVRPKPYSFVAVFSDDENFCGKFVHQDAEDIWLPTDALQIERRASTHWEWVGQYIHYEVDVDNDGSEDRVVHLQARTHADDSDRLYVFSKTAVPDVKIGKLNETHSEKEFADAADMILPGAVQISGPASIAPWWDSADVLSPHFHGGAYFEPFRYSGRTYLVATSQVSNQRHWTTIVEPKPDGSLKLKCAFQSAQPNY
jgi:hypothetical protein